MNMYYAVIGIYVLCEDGCLFKFKPFSEIDNKKYKRHFFKDFSDAVRVTTSILMTTKTPFMTSEAVNIFFYKKEENEKSSFKELVSTMQISSKLIYKGEE